MAVTLLTPEDWEGQNDRAERNFTLLGEWMQQGIDLGIPAALIEIHRERQWVTLGYDSFDEACQALYGGWRPALTQTERQAVVVKLTENGWSTRDIAPAVGADFSTVSRDQKRSGVADATPEIQGRDGKTYTRPAQHDVEATREVREANQLADLKKTRPDLADLVEQGVLGLIDALQIRNQERAYDEKQRKLEQEAIRSRNLNLHIGYAAWASLMRHPDQLERAQDNYDASGMELTGPMLRELGEFLITLSTTWRAR